MPWLAALVCCSAFDLALHDAYGVLHGVPVYDTYNAEYMNADLSTYLIPADGSDVRFAGKYPADFLVFPRPTQLPAWHLIGGKDPIDPSELTGEEPSDDYPVLLRDWIRRDGLHCLKVKLRGDDPTWDYDRLVKVGLLAEVEGVDWLTADFNCTVHDPAYVIAILDRLVAEHPRIHGMILYVEQAVPRTTWKSTGSTYDGVSARASRYSWDESAHDWQFVKLGRTLGWTGVAHQDVQDADRGVSRSAGRRPTG